MYERKSINRFDRMLVRFIRNHPELREEVLELIDRLVKNPRDRRAKTHTLSGELRGCFGASITHRYRIIFYLNKEEIWFVSIGSHDEVY